MKAKIIKFAARGLTIGGAFTLGFGAVLFSVMAFSEPSSSPSITEPTTLASYGSYGDFLGTPNSITATTTSIFGYLRTIFTDIGMTPSLYAEASSNDGSITGLLGTVGALSADGQTILNYLKNIDDNLDFPETSSVLSSDTVKGVAGSLVTSTISTATTTQSAAYYEAFDLADMETDLAAGNIINGVTIFGITGTWSVVYCDNDSDGYHSPNPTLTAGQCTGGTATSTPGTDCDDTNASKYTTITAYLDTDSDGYGAGSGYSFCTSGSAPSGYSLNSTDCAAADGTKWQYLTGYTDSDGDTYTIGTAQQICSGNSLPSGYAASSAGTDCYDSNANAYPGQTTYYTSDRGDGSFDYNCDSSETKYADYNCTNSDFLYSPTSCTYISHDVTTNVPAEDIGYDSNVPVCGAANNFQAPIFYTYIASNACNADPGGEIDNYPTTLRCSNKIYNPSYYCAYTNGCSYKWSESSLTMPCI